MRRVLIAGVAGLLLVPNVPAVAADGFSDVAADHIFVTEIEWLAEEGITRGCNPPENDRFCPDDAVTRGQMAAFLVRALDLTASGVSEFTDDDSSVFEADIERLAAAGITRGCNPPDNTRFCPEDSVTRGQMAAFLHRALDDVLSVEGETDFSDDDGSVFEADIEWLAGTGVTRGCNPPDNTLFCPGDPVTRGQMAAFLYRALSTSPQPDGFEIVSVSSDEVPGNSASYPDAITPDGRFVLFHSFGSNLVAGDTNGTIDVFVRDRQAGTTERVSVDSSGVEGDDASYGTAISDDGRYVVFDSQATNLVPADTNDESDVFVHDRQTAETTRVSVSSGGVQGDDQSWRATISADGRYVAFESWATNLVDDDSTTLADVFVHDRQTKETDLVSVDNSGNQGNQSSQSPKISADGGSVAFHSSADDLVVNDDNDSVDVFLRDLAAGQTTRVSVTSGGTEGDDSSFVDSISRDGRFVLLTSEATNLVADDSNGARDVFIHDTSSGETTRVSVGTGGIQGNLGAAAGVASADGSLVAFSSSAENLVAGDTNGYDDIFVHDRSTGQTERISITADGTQGNGNSASPLLTPDALWLVFATTAATLAESASPGQVLIASLG